MIEANNDEVICPNCVTQFRAIPVNVQDQIRQLEATNMELLEACTRMVAWAEDWKQGKTHPHDDWVFARAVIDRATGEAK